jgi:hypothetical protein
MPVADPGGLFMHAPMHTRASIPLLMAAVVGLTAGLGCRSRERQPETAFAPVTGGVGFELPGNGSVASGVLLTRPPGHEEAFVPFVATGAATWIAACRQQAGVTPPLFSFQTDAQGALQMPTGDSGATARDRCLAARAVRAGSGAPSGLPATTRVTVQLALRTP